MKLSRREFIKRAGMAVIAIIAGLIGLPKQQEDVPKKLYGQDAGLFIDGQNIISSRGGFWHSWPGNDAYFSNTVVFPTHFMPGDLVHVKYCGGDSFDRVAGQVIAFDEQTGTSTIELLRVKPIELTFELPYAHHKEVL